MVNATMNHGPLARMVVRVLLLSLHLMSSLPQKVSTLPRCTLADFLPCKFGCSLGIFHLLAHTSLNCPDRSLRLLDAKDQALRLLCLVAEEHRNVGLAFFDQILLHLLVRFDLLVEV